MYIDFGKWNGDELQKAYSFRFTETPDAVQNEECIATKVNPNHREGFDNISFLMKNKSRTGVKAKIHCAFEGAGCPEIIFVESPEVCSDGAVRYGACYEVVLYKNGVNVWRHFMDGEHHCSWYKSLGLKFDVSQNEIHELAVETKENYLTFSVDGKETTLRINDMFESFHVGITMCEGIVRVYDWTIEE